MRAAAPAQDGERPLAETPYGLLEYLPFDGPVGDSLRLYGEWAGREIQFLREFIPEGATVVDGGANIGAHTLAFARFCGPGGAVIAVEASPELAAVLRSNVHRNQLANVTVVAAALGRDQGRARISRLDPAARQNAGMLSIRPGAAGAGTSFALATEVLRLDSLGLDRLDLLKLDIEGAELQALQGGMETLARHRPTVYLEILSLDAAVHIVQLMQPLNYKPFLCTFAAYNPANAAGNAHNIFGAAREAALLFLADAAILPASAPGAEVHAITSLEQLARLFSEMPRYGDEGEHDRVVNHLRAQRAALRAQLGAGVASPEQDRSRQAGPSESETAGSEVSAEAAELREQISQARSAARELMRERDAMHAELEGARQALVEAAVQRDEAVQQQAEALIRLKAEVASLRGALLGRNQDRGAIVLALEEVRSEAQRASATAEAAQLAAEALGGRVQDLGRQVDRATDAFSRAGAETPLLASRLERVELATRRFELFYDSAPLRALRRLYIRLRGARPPP